MTKNEERCQRLMINRAYENGMHAGYEKGFKDGMEKAVDLLARRLDEEAKSSEACESCESCEEAGGDE